MCPDADATHHMNSECHINNEVKPTKKAQNQVKYRMCTENSSPRSDLNEF